jgi:hypothetical protein
MNSNDDELNSIESAVGMTIDFFSSLVMDE